MYPGYKVRDVLNEYCVTFLSLLNEGYKSRATDYKMLSYIAMLPHISKQARAEFLRMVDWASKDPSDILKQSSGDPDAAAKLKRMLG